MAALNNHLLNISSVTIMSRKYNVGDIELALESIQEKGLSIHAAAKQYNIPRGTLQNRIHNRSTKSSMGPPTVLTKLEESQIVSWIFENHTRGFPRRKHEVRGVVKEFLDACPRKNMFVDNLPGDKWYSRFLKRHPEIAVRVPEAVTNASAAVSEKDIRGWFHHLEDYFKAKNLTDVLQDPSRIFNGDESGFLLCPKGGTVLAPKGTNNVYETDKGRDKESVTVMFTFSANALIIPPMIVFHYKRIPKDVLDSIPEGIKYTKTDSGWMTSEAFLYYIKEIFYPVLKENFIQFPVVLYVDGHKTHLTYALSKLCEELKIILICLYPNSTRILQPADVAVFRPLKLGWAKEVQLWRMTNLDEQFTKKYFAPLLKLVLNKYTKRETIVNGFRTCGLYPFNPNAIDFTKCLGKSSASNQTDDVNTIAIQEEKLNTINFSKFSEIVGAFKIKQFETFEQSSWSQSADFLCLKKIYDTLKTDLVPTVDGSSSSKNTHIPAETEERNYDGQFANNPNSVISDLEIGQEITIFNTEIDSTEEVDQFTFEVDTEADVHVIDVSDIPIVCVQNDSNQTNIENFLKIIKTPARKGIRNVEKQSYIVSSTPFQKAMELKIDEKAALEQRKIDQKKEKLEKGI